MWYLVWILGTSLALLSSVLDVVTHGSPRPREPTAPRMTPVPTGPRLATCAGR